MSIYGDDLAKMLDDHAAKLMLSSYGANRETVDLLCQAAAEIRTLPDRTRRRDAEKHDAEYAMRNVL